MIANQNQYYTGTYSPDHWAMKPFLFEDPKVIAKAFYRDSVYAIFINPTDKRGYRCIVRLINNQNMESTFIEIIQSKNRGGLH